MSLTIEELLGKLDGCGLAITDDDLVFECIHELGLAPFDSVYTPAKINSLIAVAAEKASASTIERKARDAITGLSVNIENVIEDVSISGPGLTATVYLSCDENVEGLGSFGSFEVRLDEDGDLNNISFICGDTHKSVELDYSATQEVGGYLQNAITEAFEDRA